MNSPFPTRTLLGGLMYDGVKKPRVFISYYHAEDQWYRDQLVNEFSNTYEMIYDSSLDEKIDSNNTDYIRRTIREGNISNSSITIVICGNGSPKRKWIDWEIAMTLRKNHGLLGIVTPTNVGTIFSNTPVLPERLNDNVRSGFAHTIRWEERADKLIPAIAHCRQQPSSLIVNSRTEMSGNR